MRSGVWKMNILIPAAALEGQITRQRMTPDINGWCWKGLTARPIGC